VQSSEYYGSSPKASISPILKRPLLSALTLSANRLDAIHTSVSANSKLDAIRTYVSTNIR